MVSWIEVLTFFPFLRFFYYQYSLLLVSIVYAVSPSLFTGCDLVSSGEVGFEGGDVAMLSSKAARALIPQLVLYTSNESMNGGKST